MSEVLKIKMLSELTKIPHKGSVKAVGYDLYSAQECLILPGDSPLIFTDIAIELPQGTYGRLAPRSGLTYYNQIDIATSRISWAT